jgi:hypothetical protein
LAIANGEFGKASRALEQAHRLTSQAGSSDALFVRKWQAVLQLKRRHVPEKSLMALARVRREALQRRHWETVRDCDFHRAVFTKDRDLLTHLYFGTPYAAYRRMIEAELDGQQMPTQYAWKIHGQRAKKVFDVEKGEEIEGSLSLSPGQLPHRFMQILCTDFYRPFRPVTIFSMLFPSEFYNPATSLDRVHHALHRLRIWFRENRIPLQVDETAGFYKIISTGPYALRVTLGSMSQSPMDPLLCKMRSYFNGPFTVRQATESLRISQRSCQRLLKKAVEAGKLTTSGKGPAVKYSFVVLSPFGR